MITAQLFGGPRDGAEVGVSEPIPSMLRFPNTVTTPSLDDWRPTGILAGPDPHLAITEVRYQLRAPERCCASWCAWPRPCTCCPRCTPKRLVYDLVS